MSDDGESCTIAMFTGGLTNTLETQTKYMMQAENKSGVKFNLAPTYNLTLNNESALGKATAYVVNIFNAAGAKLGFETQGNQNVYKSCINAAIVAQEKGLKYKIVIVAYSKGGAEVSQAIDDLRNNGDPRVQEIAKHIDFIGVASTHCIEKGKVNLVRHIVVDGDGVAKGSAYYLHAMSEGTVINLEKKHRNL